jgi:hypothetical protein
MQELSSMQEGQLLIIRGFAGQLHVVIFFFVSQPQLHLFSLRHSPQRMNPQPLLHLNLVLCLFGRITTHLVFAASGRWEAFHICI